jgi:hypothetical protein
MAKIEFEGVPSGDYESFVWNVDEETYEKIKGKRPNKYDYALFPSQYETPEYMIYPDDIFRYLIGDYEKDTKIIFVVEAEPLRI